MHIGTRAKLISLLPFCLSVMCVYVLVCYVCDGWLISFSPLPTCLCVCLCACMCALVLSYYVCNFSSLSPLCLYACMLADLSPLCLCACMSCGRVLSCYVCDGWLISPLPSMLSVCLCFQVQRYPAFERLTSVHGNCDDALVSTRHSLFIYIHTYIHIHIYMCVYVCLYIYIYKCSDQ